MNRRVLSVFMVIGIILIGIKLTTQTMEHRSYVSGEAFFESIRGGYNEFIARQIDRLVQAKNNELAYKIRSHEALNEFRDKGTFEGKSISSVGSDIWALTFLPPFFRDSISDYKPSLFIRDSEARDKVSWAKVNQDNSIVLIGTKYGAAHLWQKNGQGSFERKFIKKAPSLLLSPDNSKVVLLENNPALMFLQNSHGEWLEYFPLGNINSAVFSPDGSTLVTSFDEGYLGEGIKIWKETTKNDWSLSKKIKREVPVHCPRVVFSPDGTTLAITLATETIGLFKKDSNGDWIEKEQLKVSGEIASLIFSNNSSKLMARTTSSLTLNTWELTAPDSWKDISNSLMHDIRYAVFTKDSAHIVTLDYIIPNGLTFWSKGYYTGWSSQSFFCPNNVRSVVLSPDNVTFVAILEDFRALVLHYLNGEWVRRQNINYVESAQFNADGTKLLTLYNNTVSVWQKDFKDTWYFKGSLKGDSLFVSVQFAVNGDDILTVSENYTAQVWKKIDLFGTTRVLEKIMLLQLLERDGKEVLRGRPHLQIILTFFGDEALGFLKEKYGL